MEGFLIVYLVYLLGKVFRREAINDLVFQKVKHALWGTDHCLHSDLSAFHIGNHSPEGLTPGHSADNLRRAYFA